MSSYPRVALLDLEDEEVAVRYAGDAVWESPEGTRLPRDLQESFDRVADGSLPLLALPDGRTLARIRVRVRFR